ncbi:hypothetical protein [Clostridium guangxiense]|nr:hypothetical protein [Clostridium guangxiense]MCD2345486.1 hypothetical protein [Clostridium guangxiense]
MKKLYLNLLIVLSFLFFAISLFYRNIYFATFIFIAALVLSKLNNTSKN